MRLEADRMVNMRDCSEDSRHRNDRRAQRVRARREQSRSVLDERVLRHGATCGTTTASPTIGIARDIERVPIERLRPSTASTTSPTTPSLIVAGKFDEAQALAAAWRKTSAPIPRPTRKLDADLHRGAAAGRRAHRGAAPRRATCRSVGAAYHIPAAAHPDSAALSLLGALICASSRPAASTRALVEIEARHQRRRRMRTADARSRLADDFGDLADGRARVARRRAPISSSPRCESLCGRPSTGVMKSDEVE